MRFPWAFGERATGPGSWASGRFGVRTAVLSRGSINGGINKSTYETRIYFNVPSQKLNFFFYSKVFPLICIPLKKYIPYLFYIRGHIYIEDYIV